MVLDEDRAFAGDAQAEHVAATVPRLAAARRLGGKCACGGASIRSILGGEYRPGRSNGEQAYAWREDLPRPGTGDAGPAGATRPSSHPSYRSPQDRRGNLSGSRVGGV